MIFLLHFKRKKLGTLAHEQTIFTSSRIEPCYIPSILLLITDGIYIGIYSIITPENGEQLLADFESIFT